MWSVEPLGSAKDSKCGFNRDCGFGYDRKKLLKCGNSVPYRGKNAVKPTQKPNAAISSRIDHILNPWFNQGLSNVFVAQESRLKECWVLEI